MNVSDEAMRRSNSFEPTYRQFDIKIKLINSILFPVSLIDKFIFAALPCVRPLQWRWRRGVWRGRTGRLDVVVQWLGAIAGGRMRDSENCSKIAANNRLQQLATGCKVSLGFRVII